MSEPAADAQPPFQFQIKHLLWLTAWIAGLCGVAVFPGADGAILFVAVSLFLAGVVARRQRRAQFFLTSALVLFFGFCLLPTVLFSPEFPRKTTCKNNLRQIALALQNYELAYGCYPPVYVTDANGKRLHSWRVLILPCLDCNDLYTAYRFDEPWNGPNNSKLAGSRPPIYACPADPSAVRPSTNTSYVAVVGAHAGWDRTKPLKAADFKDGLSNTILVVEVANSGIHWMEPRDLDMATMAKGINPKTGKGISSLHAHGACVVMADGNVRFLDASTTQQALDALLTRDGGEPPVNEGD